jgi:hypothetical protein
VFIRAIEREAFDESRETFALLECLPKEGELVD